MLETNRQSMCSDPNFAPYSAFCRIDRHACESIDRQQLLDFLSQNGKNGIGMGGCAKLIRFYDSDEDGRLSYADFI